MSNKSNRVTLYIVEFLDSDGEPMAYRFMDELSRQRWISDNIKDQIFAKREIQIAYDDLQILNNL